MTVWVTARGVRAAWGAAIVLAACGGHGAEDEHEQHTHEHEHEHEAGADDHAAHPHEEADEHGHARHPDAATFTRFGATTGLYAEVPPLVAGEEVELAVHLTLLGGLGPVADGQLELTLDGGGDAPERFAVEAVARPGLFRVALSPQSAGERRLRVSWTSLGQAETHDLGAVWVFADHEGSHGAAPPVGADPAVDEDAIVFLLEQQWQMDFATAAAGLRTLRPTVEAYGTLRPRSDGHVQVSAPLGGRLVAGEGFPRFGQRVEAGEALAAMIPRLAEHGDATALAQAVDQARIAASQAVVERERLEQLVAGGAIPQRRLTDARFAERQARAALSAAKRRQKQAKRATEGGDAAESHAVPVTTPISGTVVSVEAAPGAWIEEGAPLARVVDLTRLWLEVHVAETHAALLEQPKGAWFTVEGYPDAVFELAPEAVVTTSGLVDERSRTLSHVIAVDNPERRLKVGMFAAVHLVNGAAEERVAVPVSALLIEAGLPVVYVQIGGETFERRPVRTGIRDGDWIGITDGLEAGERVVTRGVYGVRLARSGAQAPAHGHAH